MQFKKLEKIVLQTAKKYSKKYHLKIDKNFALLKLYEEAGELAQAVLIHKRKSRPEKFINKKESKNNIAKELADIVGLIIINAKLLNIDLENAIINKWDTKKWVNKK